MELIIKDIVLEEDSSPTGGIAFEGETLGDFLEDSRNISLADLNHELMACGIMPIDAEQIIVVGRKGE